MTEAYNVTGFSGDPVKYVESLNKAGDGVPLVLFHIVVAVVPIIVLQQRGFAFEDSAITSGFLTSLVGLLFYAMGVVGLAYVFTPLSLVIVGMGIKGST